MGLATVGAFFGLLIGKPLGVAGAAWNPVTGVPLRSTVVPARITTVAQCALNVWGA